MARPAKAVSLKSGTIPKATEKRRKEIEDKLRGEGLPVPPPELTPNQREIFAEIVSILKDKNILGAMDVYILTQTAITIDDLHHIAEYINQNPDKRHDANVIRAHSTYMRDFFRECNELCLSPQARAKLGVSEAKIEPERKTLMDIFNEDDDDDY